MLLLFLLMLILFTDYYINNGTGSTPNVNFGTQYDGHTKVLPATTTVQCGETYHIKIAIANVSDNAYDSAVFLEAIAHRRLLRADSAPFRSV
mgnify:CR=1 FL=1